MSMRLALLVAATAGSLCLAQEAKTERPEPKFYKLDFVLKEVDGKRVVNSRSYSILAATDENGSIRAKEQVQVQASPSMNSWTNIDVGADIDTRRLQPIQNSLALIVAANVTGLPVEPTGTPAPPVVRHYIWNSEVIIPLRKPTTIFSSDLTTGKTQMQLELTATPVQ